MQNKSIAEVPNGCRELTAGEIISVAGGGGQKAPPPPPPSTLCWNNGRGGLACMSEGDVKVQ